MKDWVTRTISPLLRRFEFFFFFCSNVTPLSGMATAASAGVPSQLSPPSLTSPSSPASGLRHTASLNPATHQANTFGAAVISPPPPPFSGNLFLLALIPRLSFFRFFVVPFCFFSLPSVASWRLSPRSIGGYFVFLRCSVFIGRVICVINPPRASLQGL